MLNIRRCETHKLKEDTNVVEKECMKCKLPYFIKSTETMCDSCNDFFIKKVQKAKETRVKNLLDSNKIKYDSYDKTLEDSCFKYRPDFVIDRGFMVIILEVDENQHKSYNCLCEQTRMINLHQHYGGVPVLFVRYNPDEYIDKNGIHIKDLKKRESKLIDFLKGLMNRKEWAEFLSIKYLFYDGHDDTDTEYKIIDIVKNEVKV